MTPFVCGLRCEPATFTLIVDDGGDGYGCGEVGCLVGSAVGLLELRVNAVKVGLAGEIGEAGLIGLRNEDIDDCGRRAYLSGLS